MICITMYVLLLYDRHQGEGKRRLPPKRVIALVNETHARRIILAPRDDGEEWRGFSGGTWALSRLF